MARTFRIGIIGYGEDAEDLVQAWRDLPNTVVGAAADIDEKRRAAASAKGMVAFEDYEHMLEAVNPYIVTVATHESQHREHVVAALQHGCHVMCQKSLASNLKDADEMVELARVKKLKLGVYHQHAFTRAAQMAKEMIEMGDIGQLYQIVCVAKGRPAPYELRMEGTHATHLMRYIAGEVEEMSGMVLKNGRRAEKRDAVLGKDLFPEGREVGPGVGDFIIGRYFFRSGIVGELRLKSITMEGGRGVASNREGVTTEFLGTKGRIRFHHFPPGYVFLDRSPMRGLVDREVQIETGRGDERNYLREFRLLQEDFLTSAWKNWKPLVSGEDGRAALE